MISWNILLAALTTLWSYAGAAPMSLANGPPGSTIQGHYLIALKPGSKPHDLHSHLNWVEGVHKRGLSPEQFRGVERTYSDRANFHGYAGHFDKNTIEEIRKNPDVAVVEEDRIWELDYLESRHDMTVTQESNSLEKRTFSTQTDSPWGLGAVSHRRKGATEYIYNERAGQGTFAYVIDSGIRLSHQEFEGRAKSVFTAFPNETTDSFGHGTHVAGTIGGKTYGVAKKAELLAVKVFQGRRSATSVILAGLNWATNDIVDRRRTRSAVINMSLGGSYSNLMNLAVESAAQQGVVAVVAAGNEAMDAAFVSPASAPSAITVAAIDGNWTLAEYSNYGKAVDIFGPGTKITSSWIGGDGDNKTISGTSMATPHVVGLALSAISVEHVRGLDELTKYLKDTATEGQITGNIYGSPNLMGYNNIDD
ncbi:putative subtilisin-like protease [Ophiocordyceps polyrhachis-furcata BCC 54312]|uniref:Subtilisin-like protease n=1 Tax=Ophiocordyceps polyrhachis-furcata BCC 54312 TaxID=1330021 RepID=A0A367LEA0_9HYPO|nr:putative subtilisin-like protease [Ophiocordyceps polyrhachis-furcata BCC 54312]